MSEVARLKAVIELDDRDFKRGIESAGTGIKNVAREAETASAKVGGFGAALGKIDGERLKDVGRGLTVGVTLPVVGMGVACIKAASDMQALRSGLTSITGSAAETERQMVRLKEVSKLPGLGFKEAVEGSIRLQAAGLSADMAEKSLGAFGNAIASVGGGKAQLDGVTLALSQIASKGKVSAEEINQLNERLPQIRKAMQAAFGTSDTEALQKMGISSEEFIAKITREFAKIPQVAGGAKNSLETASDSIQVSMAKIGDHALPLVAKGADLLAEKVEGLSKWFDGLSPAGQNAAFGFAAVAAASGPAITGLGHIVEAAGKAKTALNALKAVQIGSLGAGGLALGAAGIVTAGIAGGYGLAALQDARQGKADPGFGATMEHLNPFRKDDPSLGAAITKGDARAMLAKMGSPRQALIQQQQTAATTAQVAAAGGTPEELARARDAKYGAELAGARSMLATVGEQSKAQAEQARLVPLLTARREDLAKQAAELEPKIKTDAKAAAAFYGLQREQAELQTQEEHLKAAAAKEIEENTKRAGEAAKTAAENFQSLQAAQFSILQTQAQVWASSAPEGQKAAAELKAMQPVISARQQQLAAEGKALLPKVAVDQEAAKRFLDASGEYWALQARAGALKRDAQQEQASNATKSADLAKKNVEEFKRSQDEITRKQKEALRAAQEAFSKSNSDRLGLAASRVSLAEAQLRNLPGNDRQKAQLLQPLLLQQFREQSRGIQGESETDRNNRLSAAAGTGTRLMETVAPGRRGIALRQLQAFQQEAFNAPVTSRALQEAQRNSASGQMGVKVTPSQITINYDGKRKLNNQDFDEFYRMYELAERRKSADSGLIGPATNF